MVRDILCPLPALYHDCLRIFLATREKENRFGSFVLFEYTVDGHIRQTQPTAAGRSLYKYVRQRPPFPDRHFRRTSHLSEFISYLFVYDTLEAGYSFILFPCINHTTPQHNTNRT